MSIIGTRTSHRTGEMMRLTEKEYTLIKENLRKHTSGVSPEELLKRCQLLGIEILTQESPLYPPLLKEIYDPPQVLYCKGQLNALSYPKTAVVGSRKLSEYGAQAALAVAEKLSRGGRAVVSGMARGADSRAHEGALEGPSPTIAVLGCGVDICYPPENSLLRERILENGLILSEYPPGTAALPFHFPQRNRIISGLCRETIVVEAGLKSGSLITAEQALEQGREVYCVPGSIFSDANLGAHRLLQEGAGLLASFREVEELLLLHDGSEVAGAAFPEKAAWLREYLDDFGTCPEDIVRESGRSASEVSAAFVLAQTAGAAVRGRDGKYYPKHKVN